MTRSFHEIESLFDAGRFTLKVVWKVTVGKKSGWSDNVVEFNAVPDKGILTSDGVARLLYGPRQHRPRALQ